MEEAECEIRMEEAECEIIISLMDTDERGTKSSDWRAVRAPSARGSL